MEAVEAPKESSLLERIRNMWEFANLVQWIFIYGRAVKIDENLDVEVSHLGLLPSSVSWNSTAYIDFNTCLFRISKWSV